MFHFLSYNNAIKTKINKIFINDGVDFKLDEIIKITEKNKNLNLISENIGDDKPLKVNKKYPIENIITIQKFIRRFLTFKKFKIKINLNKL